MRKPLPELSDAASVDEAAEALFGCRFEERPRVSQSIAVWWPEGVDPPLTILINEHSPKSALDFLALHLGRARADAIIVTGKILREEPNLRYDLRADPRWGDALQKWRRERWGLDDAPWLLILTSGRSLDLDHPVFESDVQPLIFTSDRAAARALSDAPYPVVADAAPDIRRAVDHLRHARGAACVSIEAGPSTSRALLDEPVCVTELLLSSYRSETLDRRAQGAPFLSGHELGGKFSARSSADHLDPSGSWRFERLRAS